jgi:glycosyltransferase involved in cell wall biosynthesis
MSQIVFNDLSVFTSSDLKICTPHPMYETYGEGVIKKEAREKLGLNENDKIVLFFGLIRKYKGLDLLMEAFADARIKDKNIKLLIAGEYYEDPAYYEKLAVVLGINDQIIYHTRFIPNDMVKYYFRSFKSKQIRYKIYSNNLKINGWPIYYNVHKRRALLKN